CAMTGETTHPLPSPQEKGPGDPLIGQVIGGYAIRRKVGQGGMGAVYQAYDEKLDRFVALKFLPENLTRDSKAIERFSREARATAKLEHPNVVSILGVGEVENRHYIAMQFVSGGTLDAILQDKGRLNEEEAMRLIRDAARGLEAAHRMDIIHRDVKPENIMIDSYGTVKVSDFGLATMRSAAESRLTLEGQIVGTPFTMSPEQCDGKPVDKRADIYSLGATFYRTLTGSWPFEADSAVAILMKHLHDPVPDPRAAVSSVGNAAAAICMRMMAKKPEQRYVGMVEVIRDLDRALTGALLSHQTSKRLPETRSRYLGVLLALLVACLALWMALKKWPQNASGDPVAVQPVIPPQPPPQPPAETSLARAVTRAVDQAERLRVRLAQNLEPGLEPALRRLADLDRLEMAVAHLADLDPGHDQLGDFEMGLELLKGQVASKVADEALLPLMEIQDPRDIANRVLALGPRTLKVPRVAEFAFSAMVTQMTFLVHERTPQSLATAQDLLFKTLHLEVPPARIASLGEIWPKVRQACESLAPGDAQRLRGARVAFTDPDLLKPLSRSNLESAIEALRLCKKEAQELEGQQKALVPAERLQSMEALEASWTQLSELRRAFGSQIASCSLDAARETLIRWELSGSPEAARARNEWECTSHRMEAENLEKSGRIDEALVSCVRAQSIKPRDPLLANLRRRLEETLQSKGLPAPMSARLAILDARTALRRGRTDLALEILERSGKALNPEEATEVASMTAAVIEERERCKRLQSLLEAHAWKETLELARAPALAVPPSLEARFAAATACHGLAEEARAASYWEACYNHAETGLQFLPHEPTLGTLRNTALTSWVTQILRAVTEGEMEAARLVKEGQFREAIVKLESLEALGTGGVVRSDEPLARALAQVRNRAIDIARFQDHLELARRALSAHHSAEALEHIESASLLGVDWSELAVLRKKAQFEGSRARALALPEGPERMLLLWEARSVLDGEDAEFESAFRSCRLYEAERAAGLLATRRVSADLALTAGDIPLASSIHSSAIQLLESAQAELRRNPALDVPKSLETEKVWWGDFLTRVSDAARKLERSEDNLRRFTAFMKDAETLEQAGDLAQALAALRSARAHASHLESEELSNLEARLLDLTRRVEALNPPKQPEPTPLVSPDITEPPKPVPPVEDPKWSIVRSLAAKASEAEKSGNWSEALGHLSDIEAQGLDHTEVEGLIGRVLLDWRLHLEHNREDQQEFDNLLAKIADLDPMEGIQQVQRFIRLNEGNLMVRQGRAQAEVLRLQEVSNRLRGDYVSGRLEQSRSLSGAGRHAQAEAILMEALTKYPSDRDLTTELARIMTLDRVAFKGGEFEAGSQPGEGVESTESPPWKMEIAPFALARLEVSNLQYARFIEETKGRIPEGWIDGRCPAGEETMPVTGISLEDARLFAQWAGARLPTEFEWEFAARSGGQLKRWPWGNVEDLSRASVDSKSGRTSSVFDNPTGATTQGLLNMCGNAAEWTESPYLSYPDKGFFGKVKEPAPIEPGAYVIRGGSLFDKLLACRTTARRGMDPRARKNGVGFRLCWSLDEKSASSLNEGAEGIK
ncbi:MAG: SUMF1/EgtB/PvdO family nonheme iron enzyme, partial [Planctomycetota bacterium]